MKALKKILPLLILIVSLGASSAQSTQKDPLPPKVVNAVKQGNASELTPFLNTKIELVLPGESGIFSKEQAHFILKSFFEDHKIISFEILHYGTRQNATFAIGQYNCANDHYRIYFLVKNTNDEPLIHQIRIEKQE
jgi:hypothetical protein